MTSLKEDRNTSIALLIFINVLVLGLLWVFVTQEGMPIWAYLIAVPILVFISKKLWSLTYRPGREEYVVQELAVQPGTVQTQGTVLGIKREGLRETDMFRETDLLLELAVRGLAQPVKLEVWIEDVRLPEFTTGSVLHLLQDPRQPERIAIDRRKSPTHFE